MAHQAQLRARGKRLLNSLCSLKAINTFTERNHQAKALTVQGLVYYVYGQFGYSLWRTASTQYANNGWVVSQSELKPGDLLFFGTSDKIYHVGLYIGNNEFIHACDSKTGVIISSLDSNWGTKSWYGAKRIVS